MVNNSRSYWIGGSKCPNITNTQYNYSIGCSSEIHYEVPILFCLLSIIGAILIIIVYIAYRELRTIARLFLLLIAIADLVNAVFYFLAFVYSWATNGKYTICYEDKNNYELSVCIIQSAVNSYATLVSFYWTSILGFHMIFQFYSKHYFSYNFVFIMLNIVGWGVPLILILVSLLLNLLGPGTQSLSVGWCYISVYESPISNYTILNHIYAETFIGKFWESITFFALVVICSLAGYEICKKNKEAGKRFMFYRRKDYKLVWIPFTYFLLRIWGNIRWAIEIHDYTVTHTYENPINATYCDQTNLAFSYLQAIGDPGQGWANAILYLLFTPTIRLRVLETVKRTFFKKKYNHNTASEHSQLTKNTI